jgi:hypothetical protein
MNCGLITGFAARWEYGERLHDGRGEYRMVRMLTKSIQIGHSNRQSARVGRAAIARAELTPEELEFLKSRLVGHVLVPGDDRYHAGCKVFNDRFDPHPSAIVYCMV